MKKTTRRPGLARVSSTRISRKNPAAGSPGAQEFRGYRDTRVPGAAEDTAAEGTQGRTARGPSRRGPGAPVASGMKRPRQEPGQCPRSVSLETGHSPRRPLTSARWWPGLRRQAVQG